MTDINNSLSERGSKYIPVYESVNGLIVISSRYNRICVEIDHHLDADISDEIGDALKQAARTLRANEEGWTEQIKNVGYKSTKSDFTWTDQDNNIGQADLYSDSGGIVWLTIVDRIESVTHELNADTVGALGVWLQQAAARMKACEEKQ